MKLDRHVNENGTGKYALVRLRELKNKDKWKPEVFEAIDMLARNGIIDFGDTPENEFFVIRLKDRYAVPALQAYAEAASVDDMEYGSEVLDLSMRASAHPNQKRPD